jgi:cobalt-zinc-cadmium efflux system protein
MSPQHHHCRSKHVHRHLLLAVVITFGFAVVEAFMGWHANSLALMSDAGHMVTDSLGLCLAAFAAWIASKPPSRIHSYGYGRAEVLSAWISSVLIILMVCVIIYEAIKRFDSTQHIHGDAVIITASIGMVVNILIALILHRSEQTINTRAALLHVLGDLLGSVAALISGLIVHFIGWTLIDPILSIFIGCLISISALNLLRESMSILMESVPSHIDWQAVKTAMQNKPHIMGVHDLHIWTLSSGQIALSVHVELDDLHNWQNQLQQLENLLSESFDIHHTTIQPEHVGHPCRQHEHSAEHVQVTPIFEKQT